MQSAFKSGFIFIHNPTSYNIKYVFHPSFTAKLAY